MEKSARRMTVTRRALVQRINRKLAEGGERLRTYRRVRWAVDGDAKLAAERTRYRKGTESPPPYYIVDVARARIVREHVRDLEALGRDLGVLAGWEALKSWRKK